MIQNISLYEKDYIPETHMKTRFHPTALIFEKPLR